MKSADTQQTTLSSADSNIPPDAVPHYRRLADGISDLIEEGTLSKRQIPEDYDWIVETLTAIAGADPIPLPPMSPAPVHQFGE